MSDIRSEQAVPPQQPREGGAAIDFDAYWRAIVRRGWLIMPFFSAAVVFTGLAALRMAPTYDVACTIVIDLSAPKMLEDPAEPEHVMYPFYYQPGSYWEREKAAAEKARGSG